VRRARLVPRQAPTPDAVLRTAALAIALVCAAAATAHHALGLEVGALAAWLPPCPFRTLTELPCPGCGITRALLALAQLRIGEALALHPFAPGVAVAIVGLALRPRLLRSVPSAAAGVTLVALLGWWIVRLASGAQA